MGTNALYKKKSACSQGFPSTSVISFYNTLTQPNPSLLLRPAFSESFSLCLLHQKEQALCNAWAIASSFPPPSPICRTPSRQNFSQIRPSKKDSCRDQLGPLICRLGVRGGGHLSGGSSRKMFQNSKHC